MACRGRVHVRTRVAGPEPVLETGAGADQTTQILIDLLAPLAARLAVLEKLVARFVPPPPPEGPAVAQPAPSVVQPDMVVPVVSSACQDAWLRIVEKYLKLGAPEFQGGADLLVADKWKEDVDIILGLMGVNIVQRQRLAAFSLKGDASKWYKAYFTEEECLTVTWDEFIQRFDQQFISSAARVEKEAELLRLEQGDSSVVAYESQFVSL